ncbi:MAG: hypothetical protein Q9204_001244 [Flavoplaca sp. TL-2023a]
MVQNATTSPLLRLPREIRDMIWTGVLGGRLIHLEYNYFDHEMEFDDFEISYELAFNRIPWRHIVCEDDGPEDRAKEKSIPNSKYYEAIPGAPARWGYPHDACHLDYQDPGFSRPIVYHAHEGMRLTALCVSRQLYAEANPVLWTTNTFSFLDGLTFRRFMMTRTINQKRSIRNLRFEMEWDCGLIKDWNKALSTATIKNLIGLRTLRLNILYEMKQRLWDESGDRILESIDCMGGLRRLSRLPLTSAEVAFCIREWHSEDSDYWQKADRDTCARSLQKLLLDT